MVSKDGSVDPEERSDKRERHRLRGFEAIDINREYGKARQKVRTIALAEGMTAQAFGARGEKPIQQFNAGESPL